MVLETIQYENGTFTPLFQSLGFMSLTQEAQNLHYVVSNINTHSGNKI